jgi:acetylornithine deacetylase
MSTARPYSSLEMLERLVSFDTTSRNSNLDLISFVEAYLAGFNIPSRRIENEDGTKSNLFATLGDLSRAGGIVLSGHTDVVPVDGQDWTHDPFHLIEREGKVFGRGTSDMKSFIAVALAMVPDFLARGVHIPIHFALSYDEEVGCLGVRPMIDAVLRTMPKPQVVIVGEPSEMKVVNAHKSIQSYVTTITGLEAHSSATDKGVNAIAYAAEMILFLSNLAEEIRQRGDASGRFDPPYGTLNVGLISGGNAVNIIAKNCSFSWECRGLPEQDPEEIISRFTNFANDILLPRMRAIYPKADISTRVRARSPGLAPIEGSAAETLVMQLAQCNSAEAVSYNTEAGLFQLADIPTVICGPGSIAQAHKPDEFIAIAQISECERFMQRLADCAARR